jgi:hypothetical protein
MTTWKALTGRVTLFTGPVPLGAPLSALDLFKKVWGRNPENYQSNANALAPSVAQGRRAGMTVGCSVLPGRIDLNFQPLPKPVQGIAPTFVLIENTVQLDDELQHVVESIGGDVTSIPLLRVGVYLHFAQLAPNIPEANKLLMTVIPDQIRPQLTSEEDFILQINRPRRSGSVDGVKMNHVIKWSMDRFQVFNLPLPTGGTVIGPGSMAFPQRQEFIAASVVFDVNNVAGSLLLNGQQQVALMREILVWIRQTQGELGLTIEGSRNDKMAQR